MRMTIAADATYVTSCSELGMLGRRVIRYEPDGAGFHSGKVPTNMATFETKVIATGERFQVNLEWIGEGEDGDYNEEDPQDRSILRFDVSQKNDNGNWEDVPDRSYCTQLGARLPRHVRELATDLILKAVEEAHTAGLSLKRVCGRPSWIDEAAAKAGATTPFLKTELVEAAE